MDDAAAASMRTKVSTRSVAVRSPIDFSVAHSEGERTPRHGTRLGGGGGIVASMPILCKKQSSVGFGRAERRAGGGVDLDAPLPTSAESSPISENFDPMTSSGEFDSEVSLVPSAINSPASAAAGNGNGLLASTASYRNGGRQQGSRSGIRTRQSMDVSMARGSGSKTPDVNDQRTQPPLRRMSALSSTPRGGGAAAGRSTPGMHTLFDGIDPDAARPFDSGTRASAPIRRPKLYSTDDGAQSMSSIDTKTAIVGGGRVYSRPGPPRRLERVSSIRDGRPGLADVLGRGGHVKTIQRIRSAGGLGNFCALRSPVPVDAHGGSGGAGGGDSVVGGTLNQPCRAPVSAAAARKAGGDVDVSENADANFTPSYGAVSDMLEGGDNVASKTNVGRSGTDIESPNGSDREEWGVSGVHGGEGAEGAAGGGGGGDGLVGLSLELGTLQEQPFDVLQSYDLSDGGTLQMHGFVLKPDGMKLTPTPKTAGSTSFCVKCLCRKACSRASNIAA